MNTAIELNLGVDLRFIEIIFNSEVRTRDVYPESEFFSIPDPHRRILVF
jgi:hypothetical protein